jgi:ubiquinone/menaquinone biosynthesis C-methylase UbiE
MENKSKAEIKNAVREHYATAISRKSASCCNPNPVNFDEEAAGRFVKLAGYTDSELTGVPESVTSFGCGNPVALAEVSEGQTVLDLGSGAGLDLILAARKVGPEGKVIGLDMTPEMIETCRRNLERAKISNAEVRLGEMEKMPVADGEIDWIISNCVINLSPDKEAVFAEAFRVLKPGGRVMVSDIVTHGLADEYREDLMAWVGCIAGAVDEDDYIALAEKAGFADVKVVDRMIYNETSIGTLANDACGCCSGDAGPNALNETSLAHYANKISSIKLSARKPE